MSRGRQAAPDAVLRFMNNEFPIFGGNYRRTTRTAPTSSRLGSAGTSTTS